MTFKPTSEPAYPNFYGNTILRWSGAVDSTGRVIQPGDLAVVESTGQKTDFGSEFLGRIVVVKPSGLEREETLGPPEPSDFQVSIKEVLWEHTWGVPAVGVRVIERGSAEERRLMVEAHLREIEKAERNIAHEKALIRKHDAKIRTLEAKR